MFDKSIINSSNLFSRDSNFLYNYTSDLLLKLVPNAPYYYECLKSSLEFCCDCNCPVDVFPVDSSILASKRVRDGCAILIPLLKNYSQLGDSNVFKSLDTLQLLLLLKKQMACLRRIHSRGVCHGDITGANILLNSNMEYQFIDFDQGVVNDNVSKWNVYVNDFSNLDDIIMATMSMDKLDLLSIFLKRFLGINIYDELSERNLKCLLLPRDINDTILNYMSTGFVSVDYYFDDIIDFLISDNYESPFMMVKKMVDY